LCTPVDEESRLHYYYERQLLGIEVQWYQSENAYEDIGEFIYIYWKMTTGICD
jgi:hypothetical protein